MSLALSTHNHMTASTPSITATSVETMPGAVTAGMMPEPMTGTIMNTITSVITKTLPSPAVTTVGDTGKPIGNWAINFNQSISINENCSGTTPVSIPVMVPNKPSETTAGTTNSGVADVITSSVDIDAIIQAARTGDDFAFTKLVDYYHGTAKRVAQHILRTEEAAADAVQEALIKAHRAMPRFKDGNFRSWLLRIVTNTCYDHLRRQKRRSAVSLDELVEQSGVELPTQEAPATENPETVTLHGETMNLLLQVIDELPVWHRNVVLLIDVHGYDYAEASEILELPLGTVKSRLSRARSALRNKLVEADLVPQHLRAQ